MNDSHKEGSTKVTFSAVQKIRRIRNGEIIPMPVDADQVPTRGLDLLLVPAFWELFAGDAPGSDESQSKTFHVVKSFDASLRGLPELIRVHRLVAPKTNHAGT